MGMWVGQHCNCYLLFVVPVFVGVLRHASASSCGLEWGFCFESTMFSIALELLPRVKQFIAFQIEQGLCFYHVRVLRDGL
uniref:Putative secreted protein n=1 Tax=Ixodes ricinus TaxID=34613 RepID=A0A6B0U1H1_IXORI